MSLKTSISICLFIATLASPIVTKINAVNKKEQPTTQTTQQFKRKLAQGLEKTVLKRTYDFINRMRISRNGKNKFAYSNERNNQQNLHRPQ